MIWRTRGARFEQNGFKKYKIIDLYIGLRDINKMMEVEKTSACVLLVSSDIHI